MPGYSAHHTYIYRHTHTNNYPLIQILLITESFQMHTREFFKKIKKEKSIKVDVIKQKNTKTKLVAEAFQQIPQSRSKTVVNTRSKYDQFFFIVLH